jgi:hypothetical protein
LPAFYWATDKIGGPESRSVTTGKPTSSLFTSWKAYPGCLNPYGHPWLAYRLLVFGSTCQVGQAYSQVGRSSRGLDPLVGEDREPGRWGPRGTHVSQVPTLATLSRKLRKEPILMTLSISLCNQNPARQ